MSLLVSIIVPTFNRAHILNETLDSILAQTYQNWECIVVDDGSTDNTATVLTKYVQKDKRFRFLKNHYKKGGQGARNTGIKYSKGEYLIFLDSDDLLTSSCLEKRIAYFEKYSDQDFLIFQSTLFFKEPGDSDLVANFLEKDTDDISRFIMYDYPWYTSSAIIKKEFLSLNKISWNENLEIHQDLDFYIKILLQNPKYRKIIDDPDVFFRMSGSDKLSFTKISPTIIKSKYIFLKNIFSELYEQKLHKKYSTELHGLALTLMTLFYKHSKYSLYLKVPFLFFRYDLYSQSLSLLTDHLYLAIRGRVYNKSIRRIIDLYVVTNYNERTKYLHPKGSTLGRVTISQHLNNRN